MFERVILENIRLHVKSDIPLSPGVTAICGFNGAGKSTILEGIKFAMGDVLSCTQEEFVNERAKRGTVTVFFRSRADGERYTVTRSLGSVSKWSASRTDGKPMDDGDEIVGREAMVPFLKKHLGLSRDASLQVVFQESVGVEQGMVAMPFNMAPSIRRKMFGPLLCVDKYETAWRNMGPGESELSKKADSIFADADRLAGDLDGLRPARRDLRDLNREIRKTESGMERVGLEAAGKRLVDARDRVAEAKRKVAESEQAAKDSKREAEKTAALEKDLEKAMAEVAACRLAHPDAIIFDRAKELVEGLRGKVSALEKARADRKAAGESFKALAPSIARDRKRLDELEAALKDVSVETAAAEEEKRLVSDLNAARENGVRRENLVRRRKEALTRMENLSSEKASLESRQAIGLACSRKQETLSARISVLRDTIASAVSALAQSAEKGRGLKERLDNLDKVGGECPVCKQKVDEKTRRDAAAGFEQDIEAARSEYRKVLSAKKDAETELSRKEKAVAVLSSRRFGADGKKALETVGRSLEAAKREADAAGRELSSLPAGDIAGISAALDKVKGAGERMAALGALRRELGGVKARLAADQERSDKLAVDRDTPLDPALLAAEKESGKAEETMKKTANGKNVFSKAFHRASSAGRIKAALRMSKASKTAFDSLALLSGERAKELASALAAADAAAEASAAARATMDGLLAKRAALTERRIRCEKDIAQMLALGDKVEKLREQGRKARRVANEYAFVRDVVRRTGPEMVKSLTKLIGFGATRIFSDLTGYADAEIVWDKDYGISMVKDGIPRKFRQLSGGQAMAAALSVRLAAMREVSGMDVVFCDEPTPHMDKPSRENLARQIVHLSGFSQVFVISHDDTFEVNVDNVIRVEEGETGSVVTVS